MPSITRSTVLMKDRLKEPFIEAILDQLTSTNESELLGDLPDYIIDCTRSVSVKTILANHLNKIEVRAVLLLITISANIFRHLEHRHFYARPQATSRDGLHFAVGHKKKVNQSIIPTNGASLSFYLLLLVELIRVDCASSV